MTYRDIIRDALTEIGVLAQGDALPDGDAVFARGKLRRLLDAWNAEQLAVYCQTFATFTLEPGLSPHTIGPAADSPTWTVTQRPVSIAGLSLVLEGGIYTPITLRDAQWWQAQTLPGMETSIPTDCYYEPAWPLGRLYFWPVPTVAYDVEIQTRVLLSEVDFDTEFSLPPGYQSALTDTLAEQLCASFGRPGNADLSQRAAKARAIVWRNNGVTPRLQTQDCGMPSRAGGRFNYRNGQFF